MKGYAKALLFVFVSYVSLLLLNAILGIQFQNKFNTISQKSNQTLYDDDTFHHRWLPNKTVTNFSRGTAVVVNINSQKWPMQKEISLEKSVGKRLFCVGDSNTQAVVNETNKWPNLLQSKWNQNNANMLEVVNTGTSSWSFLQYFLILNEIYPYKPDAILVGIDMTDLANDALYFQTAEFGLEGQPLRIRPHRAEKIVLTPTGYFTLPSPRRWDFLLLNYVLWNLNIMSTSANVNDIQEVNWFAGCWSQKTQAQFEKSIQIIRLINAECKKRGVRLLVTSFPHLSQFKDPSKVSPLIKIRAKIDSWKIPYFDLYNAIVSTCPNSRIEELYWPTDPTHFNVEGNKIIAEKIYPFVKDNVR